MVRQKGLLRPVDLDFPAPQLQIYPIYTIIADRSMPSPLLGMANRWLKDYFDLRVMLERETIDIDIFATAIAVTFQLRG